MSNNRDQPEATSRASATGIRLVDLAGLVVGYALAGLVIRVFWPESRSVNASVAVVLAVFYLWLGLATSGPVLVLLRRMRPAFGDERSWGELAWVAVGSYWLGLLLIARARQGELPINPVLLGVPIVIALGIGLLRGGPKRPTDAPRPWTHQAAGILFWTWPIAWICLVLVGHTLF
jgi:hypothetical protein